MARRTVTNKLITAVIILLLVVVLCVEVYYKFVRHWKL